MLINDTALSLFESFLLQVSGCIVHLCLWDAPSDNINLFNLNYRTPAEMLR